MNRTIEELEKKAVNWWPESLRLKDASANIIPKLIETQDKFLNILSLSTKNPESVFSILKASEFPANLFLKHLSVLSDYGGEPLQRLGRNFENIFPEDNGGYYLNYSWEGKQNKYTFKILPCSGLGNKKLFIDGKGLLKEEPLSDLLYDVCMILLYGASSDVSEQAGLEKCEIGNLIGNNEIIEKYVKQKYIHVSRITGGATANNLGQFAQTEIVEFLTKTLGESFNIQRNGTIILSEYNKPGGMPFDIVVEKNNKKVGIEVSFQVTTNSTIERKSGQSKNRKQLMKKDGYHIAYVIDGAGNFQRKSAISTICENSDCTIAYSESEFKLLANWIKEVLK